MARMFHTLCVKNLRIAIKAILAILRSGIYINLCLYIYIYAYIYNIYMYIYNIYIYTYIYTIYIYTDNLYTNFQFQSMESGKYLFIIVCCK